MVGHLTVPTGLAWLGIALMDRNMGITEYFRVKYVTEKCKSFRRDFRDFILSKACKDGFRTV